jgi:uncharacterized protein
MQARCKSYVDGQKTQQFIFFMMKTFINNNIINNLEFAQKQQEIADNFAPEALNRLAETLVLTGENAHLAAINFTLTGDIKRFRQPSLHLHIKSRLPVICQRCLEEMLIDLELDFDYLLSNFTANELEDHLQDSDDSDWLEINAEMDVRELVEDELLLAMPIAPAHDASCGKLSMQSGEKPNPFAVLKSLSKSLNKS